MRRAAIFALFGLGALITLALIAFVLVGALYRAPSESMEPTITVGDRFAILKLGGAGVGDVVVVSGPVAASEGPGTMCAGGPPPAGQMCARASDERADVKFVKRIVAEGGDRISMRGGLIVRDGERETTDGPRPCDGDACEFPREITVPEGHVFLLGDNRGASDDSRFWGPVPEGWIVGRYWFKVG